MSLAPLHFHSLCDFFFFLQCCPSDHGDPQQRPAEFHRGQDGGAGGAAEQSSRFPGKHPQQVSNIPWSPPFIPSLGRPSFKGNLKGKTRNSQGNNEGKVEAGLG